MRVGNNANQGQRSTEIGQVWEEVLSGANICTFCCCTFTTELEPLSTVRIRAAGAFAGGSIIIACNTFTACDGVTIDCVALVEGVAWCSGIDVCASAASLAVAINACVTTVVATVACATITLSAATAGLAGNCISLAEVDICCDNFTLSGANLTGGNAKPTTVTIGGVLAATMDFGEVLVFNAGDADDGSRTVTLDITIATAFVQRARSKPRKLLPGFVGV